MNKKTVDQSIFRSYDVRGEYPQQLNKQSAYLIARGFASFLKTGKKIIVGRDIRDSSQKINSSIIKGLQDSGASVIDIGQASTEMIYFAVNYLDTDGGLALTASHNPPGWAGIKMVREKSIPLSSETGIEEIKKIVNNQDFIESKKKGILTKKDLKRAYYDKLLSLVDVSKIKPLRVVVNALNGVGGIISQDLLSELPIKVIEIDFEPKPTFPKGEPDPLLPKRQQETSQVVKDKKADLGASFDGDGDRCLFFDDRGRFIRGSYVVALLAKHLLKKNPTNNKIITDCRLFWPSQEVVTQAGGELIINKPGHSFLKQAMRDKEALFAGEVSGHFYYKDYYYADSGLLTLLYFLELLSGSTKSLSEIIKPLESKYPATDEINFKAQNKQEIINKAKEDYSKDGQIEEIDGIGVNLGDWRFNLRASGTEPKIRLNLEAKNKDLLKIKERELISFVKNLGGKLS